MTSPRLGFIVFLGTFFLIYGSVHALVIWRSARHLALPAPAMALLGLFGVCMTLSPLAIRLLHRLPPPILRAAEMVTFLWMALLFYLFFLLLSADLLRLALLLGGARRAAALLFGPRAFALILAAAAAVCLYGALEAGRIRTTRLTFTASVPSPPAAPVRIVQVSDLHLGALVGRGRLERILDAATRERPDILVATGDVVDGVGDRLDGLSSLWARVPAPLGRFAVTGNHEYYAGIDESLAFLRRSGFRVLRNEAVSIPGAVTIAGLEYPGRRFARRTPVAARTIPAVLEGADRSLFTVVLNHVPGRFTGEAAPAGVSLQLSGHTHGGQLFPFIYVVRLFYRFSAGLYTAGGSALYVSRGAGTWGPPLRVLAPPEITSITIVPPGAAGVGGGGTGTNRGERRR